MLNMANHMSRSVVLCTWLFVSACLVSCSLYIGPEVTIVAMNDSDERPDVYAGPFVVNSLSFHEDASETPMQDCHDYKHKPLSPVTLTRDSDDEDSFALRSLFLRRKKFHVLIHFLDEYKACTSFDTSVYNGTSEPCQSDEYGYLFDQHTGQRSNDQVLKRACVPGGRVCATYLAQPLESSYP